MDELQAVVNLNLPGIICITETWLDSLDDRDRMDGDGGVCAYVNSHIPCKRLVDFESPNVESLWLTRRPF